MINYAIYGLILFAIARLNLASGQRWRRLIYIALITSLVALIWTTSLPPDRVMLNDYKDAYYLAGQRFLGALASVYNLPGEGLGFVNLPIVAVLFAPLSVFNIGIARILFFELGIMATVLSCWLLIHYTQATGWRRLALVGLFAANGPLYYSVRIGNTSHFLLLLLVVTLFCLRKKQDDRVGLLLACVGLIKPPLLLLGGYFILRQRWQVVQSFTATMVAAVGLSVLVYGVPLHQLWLERCVLPFKKLMMLAFNEQSLRAVLGRLIRGGNITNWQLVPVEPTLHILTSLLTAILIGMVLYTFWRSPVPKTVQVENCEFSVMLILTLLISSISWTHYYAVLLLPLALWIGQQIWIPQGLTKLTIVAGLLISLPVLGLGMQPLHPLFDGLISRCLVSHYFIGGLMLMLTLLVARLRLVTDVRSTPVISQARRGELATSKSVER